MNSDALNPNGAGKRELLPPMNSSAAVESKRMKDFLPVLVRWLLGGLFVYMGLSKALDPVQFLKLVRQYQMVNQPFLLDTIPATLPWFEVYCGVLLLAGVAVRGPALMLVCMLVPFTLVVVRRALAMHAMQAIPFCAIKFDCGCGTGETFICQKVVENCGLIVLACWMLAGRGRQFSLRYRIT